MKQLKKDLMSFALRNPGRRISKITIDEPFKCDMEAVNWVMKPADDLVEDNGQSKETTPQR